MKKGILQFGMVTKISMIALLLGAVGKTYAYDFSAACESGQTLYYNITDVTNHYVELTYPGLDQFHPWDGFNKPEGNIVLPNVIVNNGISYSLTSINTSTFRDCNGLSGSLSIPNSVVEIGARAFEGCSGFNGQLTLSNNTISIGSTAFYGCNGFNGAVVIPNSVETVGQYAFYNCYRISELTIGEGVSSIGQYAFWNCSNLSVVHYNAVNCSTMYTVYNSIYLSVFGLTPSIVELSIGPNVEMIPNYAFKRCLNITNQLVIPESVVSIGEAAFSICSGLSGNLIIPNSVISIGYSAFSYCSGLSGDLIIPNSVLSIGNSAFLNCSGFTGLLNIGNSVTSIGSESFSNCSGFTSLNISNSVIDIGSSAFYNCSGINEISIPDAVSSIGYEAFLQTGWYNSHVDGVLYIDDWCLGYKGQGINTIQIQNGIKHIADGAFMMDSDLTTVSIANTVTTIGNNAFANCENLAIVELSNSLTTIEDNAFSLCSCLHSISLPNSLISIKDYAFWQCGLQSIAIPNSVTLIGANAFELCEMMNSVTFGSSITEIGEYAFGSCWVLNSIISLSQQPPFSGDGVFMNISKSVPVYVPYGSIDTYLAAIGWSDFTNYHELAYTTISGYGEGEGKWAFIASPLMENTIPTAIDNMIAETPTNYDLYRFNQSAVKEWQNYKQVGDHYHFNLVNGQGYLYANAEDVNLIFKGTFNENESEAINLTYDNSSPVAGWNLVGNPFPVSAYANRSYYVMNEEGTAIEPVAVSMETAIPACTGVMLKADNTGETVAFSKTASRGQENQGVLQIALKQVVNRVGPSTSSGSSVDKAIVSFNAGDRLEKFVFNEDNAQLYIPRGTNNYAIISAEKSGEMPLNFEAKKNGTYTISVDAELAYVNFLHLIDNLTGDDIDLLNQPAYTFEAKTTDYASRFRLVFSANETDDPSTESETFAFINGSGNLSILGVEGEATLQVMDVLGHMLSSEAFSGSYEKKLNVASGTYVLRLINGDDVKVQKIVVK